MNASWLYLTIVCIMVFRMYNSYSRTLIITSLDHGRVLSDNEGLERWQRDRETGKGKVKYKKN